MKYMSGCGDAPRKGVAPVAVYQALMLASQITDIFYSVILGIVSIMVILSNRKK